MPNFKNIFLLENYPHLSALRRLLRKRRFSRTIFFLNKKLLIQWKEEVLEEIIRELQEKVSEKAINPFN